MKKASESIFDDVFLYFYEDEYSLFMQILNLLYSQNPQYEEIYFYLYVKYSFGK